MVDLKVTGDYGAASVGAAVAACGDKLSVAFADSHLAIQKLGASDKAAIINNFVNPYDQNRNN